METTPLTIDSAREQDLVMDRITRERDALVAAIRAALESDDPARTLRGHIAYSHVDYLFDDSPNPDGWRVVDI